MPIHAHFLWRTVLTHKVGQTDLVFGVRSGFIRRSVYGRLQVSVCSGYNLFCPLNTRTDIQTAFDQLILIARLVELRR